MARFTRTLGLAHWSRHTDLALLAARLVISAFLLWGVWDNIASPARMAEFRDFLAAHDFPLPLMMARLSVWAQFLVGCGLVAGLLVRWSGVICAINFVVAVVMVDAAGGIRAAFPATALILFGLLFATIGGGRYALDRIIGFR